MTYHGQHRALGLNSLLNLAEKGLAILKVPVALTSGDGWGGCVPPPQELGGVTFLSTAKVADEDTRHPGPDYLSLQCPLYVFPHVIP